MHRLPGGLLLLALWISFAACAPLKRYAPTGPWADDEPQTLGEVTACAGKFCIDPKTGEEMRPLALRTPPEDHVIRMALRREAATVYNMPEEDLVLGEIRFEVFSSMVGNIRGWRATAPVARRK